MHMPLSSLIQSQYRLGRAGASHCRLERLAARHQAPSWPSWATLTYTTACCSPSPTGDGSFVPLTVSYAERFSAAGRTSSGYIKREGRAKDNETLVSRLVDRPIRPMFEKGWANETQVLQWVMSYDGVNCPEPLAITAAGAALLISDIPFSKAVAGVRVGYILSEDRFVVNPNNQEQERSCLDLLLAGTRDSILMIEGFCDLLTEEQMLKAVEVCLTSVHTIYDLPEALRLRWGTRRCPQCALPSRDGPKRLASQRA